MASVELVMWVGVRDEASELVNQTQGRFKKLTDTMHKKWVKIAAVFTAATLAIKKSFDLAELGAKAAQIESAFSKMATAVGADFKELKRQILEASKSTVNFSNIAAQATVLLGRGVTQSQVIELMKVARVEAQKTGKGVEESFNQISGAIAGGFLVTVKRNFGLAVDLAGAYEDFSKQTGKSVDEIRKYHAAQALANQVIGAAKMDLAAFNTEMRTNLEHIQSLGAWWTGFKETLGQIILAIIQMVVVMIKTLQAGFAGVIEGLSRVLAATTTGIQKTLEGINKIAKSEAVDAMIQKLRDSSQFMRDFAESEKQVGIEFARAAEDISFLITKTHQISDAQTQALRSSAQNFRSSVSDAKEKFSLIEEMAKNIAVNLQNALSNSFFKLFSGKIKSGKDILKGFGESMLMSLADLSAFYVASPIVKKLETNSYQLGTSYVPRTGLYSLHKGERISKASKNDQNEIVENYYITATDAKSFIQNMRSGKALVWAK